MVMLPAASPRDCLERVRPPAWVMSAACSLSLRRDSSRSHHRAAFTVCPPPAPRSMIDLTAGIGLRTTTVVVGASLGGGRMGGGPAAQPAASKCVQQRGQPALALHPRVLQVLQCRRNIRARGRGMVMASKKEGTSERSGGEDEGESEGERSGGEDEGEARDPRKKVKSPMTGRPIYVGGPAFQRIIDLGYLFVDGQLVHRNVQNGEVSVVSWNDSASSTSEGRTAGNDVIKERSVGQGGSRERTPDDANAVWGGGGGVEPRGEAEGDEPFFQGMISGRWRTCMLSMVFWVCVGVQRRRAHRNRSTAHTCVRACVCVCVCACVRLCVCVCVCVRERERERERKR